MLENKLNYNPRDFTSKLLAGVRRNFSSKCVDLSKSGRLDRSVTTIIYTM